MVGRDRRYAQHMLPLLFGGLDADGWLAGKAFEQITIGNTEPSASRSDTELNGY
ncbi:hypothetical protein D3C73_1668670 [compost metagenome]